PKQMLRILHDVDAARPIDSLEEVRPRLDRAVHWALEQMPADQRTQVLSEPDTELLAGLEEDEVRALRLLVDGLDEHWSLAGLTTLVYGVPKMILGLPLDVAPTAELKAVQRRFFILLYRLLTGRDTGPRLPTLLLAIGPDRVRTLVTP
ncbi:lysine--tRNA ligase, partial [Actinoplanes sp. NPDC051633]